MLALNAKRFSEENSYTRSTKMKKKYESAEISFVWLDERDIITASSGYGGGPIDDRGPIGGGGADIGGWT